MSLEKVVTMYFHKRRSSSATIFHWSGTCEVHTSVGVGSSPTWPKSNNVPRNLLARTKKYCIKHWRRECPFGTGPRHGKITARKRPFFDVFLPTFDQWNVSHTIHTLRFGAEYPGHIHQLDGVERFIGESHGMYQYYFEVNVETTNYSCTRLTRG